MGCSYALAELPWLAMVLSACEWADLLHLWCFHPLQGQVQGPP